MPTSPTNRNQTPRIQPVVQTQEFKKLPQGKFYLGAGEPNLQQTRPLTVFVPNDLVINGKLDMPKFQAQRWHSINAGANKNAVGSHVFPDLTKEVEPTADFLLALNQFLQKRIGKPSAPRKPGKQGLDEMGM
jgi:hypothetical protein